MGPLLTQGLGVPHRGIGLSQGRERHGLDGQCPRPGVRQVDRSPSWRACSTVCPRHRPRTLMYLFFPMALQDPLFQLPGLLTVTAVCDQMQGRLHIPEPLIVPAFPGWWVLVSARLKPPKTAGRKSRDVLPPRQSQCQGSCLPGLARLTVADDIYGLQCSEANS